MSKMQRVTKDNRLIIRIYLLASLFFANIAFVNAQIKKEEHNHSKDIEQQKKKEHEEHGGHGGHGGYGGHDHDNFKKYFVGIHGIVLSQSMGLENGSKTNWNSIISVPMFGVNMGYKFSEKTQFLGKIEFENGGFGGAQEAGVHGHEAETEVEKSGAVVVERVFITHEFSEHFKMRVGHMPVPIGQLYLAHRPTEYLASIGAKADSRIIPREWIETGVSILGNISDNLKYEVLCLAGLDADYFTPEAFISGGRQSKFETTFFNSPAFIARLEYDLHEFKIGLVGYWNKTDKNAQDQAHAGRNIDVSITELDARYRTNKLHFLGNIILGNATNTQKLYEPATATEEGRNPIAKQALSASAEFGYNLNHNEKLFSNHKNALWLFGRIDFGNPMLEMPKGYNADISTKKLSFTGGVNFFLNESIALKADYEYIMVGDKDINNTNILSLSVAYSFFPYKK